ncbi:unnamed protein product [Agarophyton chilense]
MTRPFIVFALFLALHSLTAVAQHPGSRRPSPPLDEAPKFDPKELGKKFGLPNCMYFPFHHRYDLFTAGEQKLVGKVSLDLSDKELRVRYSLDKCTIRAASIDITPKMFPVALPNRFPCKAKAVKGSHELHVALTLMETPYAILTYQQMTRSAIHAREVEIVSAKLLDFLMLSNVARPLQTASQRLSRLVLECLRILSK